MPVNFRVILKILSVLFGHFKNGFCHQKDPQSVPIRQRSKEESHHNFKLYRSQELKLSIAGDLSIAQNTTLCRTSGCI